MVVPERADIGLESEDSVVVVVGGGGESTWFDGAAEGSSGLDEGVVGSDMSRSC